MFKQLGNIASILKQAQQMQGRMSELQNQLAAVKVEGHAGGGMVKVEANGQQRILGFQIENSVLEMNDPEMLEDLLVAATNQALEKAKETAAAEMSKLTGDLNIPGLEDALEKFGMGGSGSPSSEPS